MEATVSSDAAHDQHQLKVRMQTLLETMDSCRAWNDGIYNDRKIDRMVPERMIKLKKMEDENNREHCARRLE